MHLIDYLVIAVFSLGIIVSGMSFQTSGKNTNSFFAAGGSVPWWINGLSLFMSFFSAGTFVVWGSIAYTNGWVSVTIQWTMAIAGFIIGFFIAPKWHKAKILTAAEFITRRLGLNTQKIYSYLFLFVALFTTGGFLYPVAKIVVISTGINITLCIIILGAIIILYTTIGGLWAVLVTDVLQFIVLTAAVLIVVPLAFKKVGGLQNFIEQTPEGYFDFFSGEYTLGFVIAFGLYNLFFISGNWAYVQRYTSVPSAKDAKKVGYLFGSLYLISPIIWMLPPMIYKVFNSELTGFGDEGAYLMMCKEVLPIGMLGLMLGAMIFATSSSVNTTLNIASGVITNDLYKNFKPKATEKELMRIARISTVIFGIFTILIALLIKDMGGIVEVVLSVAAITGGALYLPPLWSLFSKLQTGKSILLITFLSLSINLFFKFFSPFLLNISLNRTEEIVLGVCTPISLLMLFEILLSTINKESKSYKKYIAMQELLEYQKNKIKIDSNNQLENKHGIKIISYGVLGTGLLILLIGLFTNNGQSLVVVAGAAVIIVGALIKKRNSD